LFFVSPLFDFHGLVVTIQFAFFDFSNPRIIQYWIGISEIF